MIVDTDDFHPFMHSEYRVKLAMDDWELRQAQQLRKQVFVNEQRIFETSDHDVFDNSAHTLIASTALLGIPDAVVGTVRIHEQEPGVWMGSRLAVDRSFRHAKGLGTGLIKMAVCTARTWGCKTFYANVQIQNQALFQRLGWVSLGEISIHGTAHVFMQANLDLYPPVQDPSNGLVHLIRKAEQDTQRKGPA